MALQNHPQIQAAQNEAAFSNRQVVEARSAYFPTVSADITGSGANNGARIGAGFISDSRLFDRFGAGFMISLVPEGTQIPSGYPSYGGQFAFGFFDRVIEKVGVQGVFGKKGINRTGQVLAVHPYNLARHQS